MSDTRMIPEYMKEDIERFYDDLCRVLTDWEQGEISDFELYDFMVDLANEIPNLSYDS